MTAPILDPSPENIARACSILKAGGLVAMPTETVYGLAADARNPDAVARLYATKNRPQFNPLIAHVASRDMAQMEGCFSALTHSLADTFWPGPLTMVMALTANSTVCDLARAGLDSVALRHPAHLVAQALLSAYQGPLVAPSANPSGQISPTCAQHVAADLGERIDLILDGGPCQAGLESTILDVRTKSPALLRSGSLNMADILKVIPQIRAPQNDPNAPRSPGQLLRHYAPRARLRLNASEPENEEAYLGFGPGPATLNLSQSGDLTEAARHLFAMLRRLDAEHSAIAVAPIPQHGLGEAINDRLRRAASASRDL